MTKPMYTREESSESEAKLKLTKKVLHNLLKLLLSYWVIKLTTKVLHNLLKLLKLTKKVLHNFVLDTL